MGTKLVLENAKELAKYANESSENNKRMGNYRKQTLCACATLRKLKNQQPCIDWQTNEVVKFDISNEDWNSKTQ